MGKKTNRALTQMVMAAVSVGCVASANAAITAWQLVPSLDPNNGTALTVADAPSNNGVGGINLATFTTAVATAYTANLGGVINWDGAGSNSSQLTSLAANTTTGFTGGAVQGWLGNNTLGGGVPSTGSPLISLLRTDVNASAGVALDWNTQGNILASGNGTSGGYLGIQGTASYTLTFQTSSGMGVVDFGITSIARNASGQTSGGNFLATFSDGSTFTTSTATIASSSTTPAAGTFFGIAAPAGLSIASVAFTSTGGSSARFDDTAFIVAPTSVPEPASVVLLGLAGGTVLLRRRRAVTL